MIIHRINECDSVLNVAQKLLSEGSLQVYDSVQARVQTAGRGQYGRTWQSPEGNLYCAMRLPLEGCYRQGPLPLIFAVHLMCALENLGLSLRIKWMNDLVAFGGKVGGILLEKKGGALIAGIGINCVAAPDPEQMRADHALPATTLKAAFPDKEAFFDPEKLWDSVSAEIAAVSLDWLEANWLERARHALLWRNKEVTLRDGDSVKTGILIGLEADGALRLIGPEGLFVARRGSILPVASIPRT